MNNRMTMADVARRAGVSVSTVSRIATGNGSVTREVEDRVRTAAADLGVPLDPKQTSNILAFLLSNRNVLHPLHSRILFGAQTYCRSQNWDLLFLSFDYAAMTDAKDLRFPQILLRRNLVRAVILSGENHANLLSCLEDRRILYSVLGNNVVGDWGAERHDTVFQDDIRGACEMTKYLISLGHRDIRYVGDCGLPWFCRTRRGYEMAMSEVGLEPRVTSLSVEASELGYLAAKSLLTLRVRPTAIVAGSDQAAEGVYRAARDLGLAVPEDLSVGGFNDTDGRIMHPPLTTVHYFPEELGRCLAELALRRVRDPKVPPQQITIPTRLIKRESCAPPAVASHLQPGL